MRLPGLATCALILLAATAQVARADGVVLIDPPARLEEAVRTSLSPWSIPVAAMPGPAPDPTMPGSAERARQIAAEQDADAVVWITDSADGHALWAYDRDDDRVVVRPLQPPPPFDPPQAAAVALSVKTLLRHSAVAPASERYGSEGAPGVAAPEEAPPRRLRFESAIGARYQDTGADAVELRLSLGGSYAFASLGHRLELVGLLSTGPGLVASGDDFVGHVSDLSIQLAARAPLPVGERAVLAPFAGATLHITEIEGTIPSESTAAEASRQNPSLDGGVLLRLAVSSRLEVGANLQLSWLARRQRYLVRGEPVFELPPAHVEAGVVVAFPLL